MDGVPPATKDTTSLTSSMPTTMSLMSPATSHPPTPQLLLILDVKHGKMEPAQFAQSTGTLMPTEPVSPYLTFARATMPIMVSVSLVIKAMTSSTETASSLPPIMLLPQTQAAKLGKMESVLPALPDGFSTITESVSLLTISVLPTTIPELV